MHILLIRLVSLGIITWASAKAFRRNQQFEITEQSNCDDLLKKFDQRTTISSEKVANLRKAHETIRRKLQAYFERTRIPSPTFYIQGSYKTKTIVENRSTKCDIDLAVIFPRHPGVQVETLQNHIKNALTGHTTRGITIKETCVRLHYVRDFHIDLPIYFTDPVTGEMYYGSRGWDWELSDPKAFVKWFVRNTKNKPQLVRIIRYLKAWADHTKIKSRKKFPSGLALTLWAIEHYTASNRDDLALLDTSSSILQYLNDNFKGSWKAMIPVEPYDNVLNKLNRSQKSGFYEEMEVMVELMTEAVSSTEKAQAYRKWKRIFGGKF